MSRKENNNSGANPYFVGAAVATGVIAALGGAAYLLLNNSEDNQRNQAVTHQARPRRANSRERTDQEECSICLSGYGENQAFTKVPLCGHKFHVMCLSSWIAQHEPICPLCRGHFTVE